MSQTESNSQAIHACAVAIGEKGLLILGESGAGKSRLLVDLLLDSLAPKARLVADDRVLLTQQTNQLIARPHPAIAGQIELRGVGIKNFSYLDAVIIDAVLQLTHEKPERLPREETLWITFLGVTLPCFTFSSQSFSSHHLRAIWPFLKGTSLIGS
jgi:HPr kinase/phosphorylase